MGLDHVKHAFEQAERAKRLEIAEDKPKGFCKYGCPTVPCRHTRTEEKHKKHIGLGGRGVPIIGIGSGAIAGTAPGGEIGAGRRLEQAGREIAAARMAAARARLNGNR